MAKVGNTCAKQMDSVGPHGVGTANYNGERLRTCCEMHKVINSGNWLPHKDMQEVMV